MPCSQKNSVKKVHCKQGCQKSSKDTIWKSFSNDYLEWSHYFLFNGITLEVKGWTFKNVWNNIVQKKTHFFWKDRFSQNIKNLASQMGETAQFGEPQFIQQTQSTQPSQRKRPNGTNNAGRHRRPMNLHPYVNERKELIENKNTLRALFFFCHDK